MVVVVITAALVEGGGRMVFSRAAAPHLVEKQCIAYHSLKKMNKTQSSSKITKESINTNLDNKNNELLSTHNENKELFPIPNEEFKFILRIYGGISKFLNRNLEVKIVEELSKNSLCAKILYKEETFRIEEYLEDYYESTTEYLHKNMTIIYDLIINFNLIELLEFKISNKIIQIFP